MNETRKNKKIETRTLAMLAILAAVAYVVMYLSKLIPVNVLGFLNFDLKDTIVVITGFMFGPLAAAAISLIVSFIEMVTISSTGVYGFLMNAIATCAFTVPAAWAYAKMRSQKGAVIGLLSGVLTMAVCMVAWNYIITPYYMSNDQVSVAQMRRTVAGMLLPVFLPFNLVKGGLNAALAMLLYKPVVGALRRVGLVAQSSSGKKRQVQPRLDPGCRRSPGDLRPAVPDPDRCDLSRLVRTGIPC